MTDWYKHMVRATLYLREQTIGNVSFLFQGKRVDIVGITSYQPKPPHNDNF